MLKEVFNPLENTRARNLNKLTGAVNEQCFDKTLMLDDSVPFFSIIELAYGFTVGS